MGWEWHDRDRGSHGRFAGEGGQTQIHLRCTPEARERIRNRATALQMDITGYLLGLVNRDIISTNYGITVPVSGKLRVHTENRAIHPTANGDGTFRDQNGRILVWVCGKPVYVD